jgi:hypothetical protein
MAKSRTHIAISLTQQQLDYVRELVAHDRSIGDDLPEDDDSFDWKNDMADEVLAALDAPMPVYVAERVNA